VRDVIEYIVFAVECEKSSPASPTKLVAKTMISILDSDYLVPESTRFYEMLVLNAAKFDGGQGQTFLDKVKVGNIVKSLFNWCQRMPMKGKSKAGEEKNKCLELYENLLSLESISSVISTTAAAQAFIQGASMFGLLPLECMNWSSVICDGDSLAFNIRKLEGKEKLTEQRKSFHSIVQSLKHISPQATEVFAENVLKATEMPNCCRDAYFYLPHKRRMQHFYRLKKTSYWELLLLRLRQSSRRGKSKTQSLTRWKDGETQLIHWVKIDGKLQKESKLKIPEALSKLYHSTPAAQSIYH